MSLRRHSYRENIFVEAVLIPILDLQVSVTGIRKYFERDNKHWAMNNDGCKGPIGQLLLGAYCTKYFPSKHVKKTKMYFAKIGTHK